MAFGNGPRIVTDGLVVSLDAADRNSYASGSTVWNNLSGNNYAGSLINGAGFNISNGGSISFDGIDDYVSQTYNLIGSTDFSIEIWARNDHQRDPVTDNNSLALGGIVAEGGSYLRYGVYNASNPTPGYVLFYAAGPNTFVGPTFPNNFSINAWHCYTFTRTTTSQRIYTDATLLGESTYSNTTALSINYNGIGRYAFTYWKGLIPTYRIYNRALSPTEILQNYNAQKSRFGL
jgi:hypothetical protein